MYNFYDSTVGQSAWVAKCKIDPSLTCLEGHFPMRPIFPAVGQLDMIMQFISQVKNETCTMIGAKAIKFIGLIEPSDVVCLKLDVEKQDVQFTLFVGERLCTKGSLDFKVMRS